MINNDVDFAEDTSNKTHVIKHDGNVITLEMPFPKPRAYEVMLHMIMRDFMKRYPDRLDELMLAFNTHYFLRLEVKERKAAAKADIERDSLPTDQAGFRNYWYSMMKLMEPKGR